MGRINAKTEIPPAPGDLRIVQAFVNTADREAQRDELTSPQALAGWLTRQGLLAPGRELAAADLQRAIEAREGLRSLLAAGGAPPDRLRDTLDGGLSGALLQPRFGPDGTLLFEPSAPDLDGALARLLAIVAEAQREGHWARFKVCASGTCRLAFYDYSTNGTGLSCRPRCGNRITARDSRRRRGRRR